MRYFLLFCLFYFDLNAQKAYTLEECIETAFRQSPDIQIQNLVTLQASDAYSYSKKNIYPSVSGSFSQGMNGGRSIDPFTNSFIQRSISSNSIGLGTNWTIFNGFALKNQIALNKNGFDTEKMQMLLRKKELKTNVILAFMQVLITQELLKISQEQRKDLESQLEVLKEKVKEGILPKSQISDFEAQIANVFFEEYSAKNNLELAKLNLSQWLGFSSKTAIEVKDLKNTFPKTWEFSKMHPAQKILDLKCTEAKLGKRIAEAAKYPTLSLNGGFGSAYSSAAASEFSYFNQLNYNFNQYLRLGLNIPIYSNGQIKAKIANATIQEQIVKKQMDQQNLKLNQEFEKQKMEIALLTEKLNFTETNLRIQNKAYLAAKERFTEGIINSVELNTFRVSVEKAKVIQIQTQIELNYKSLILETFLE